jgi:hypothetical protein
MGNAKSTAKFSEVKITQFSFLGLPNIHKRVVGVELQ